MDTKQLIEDLRAEQTFLGSCCEASGAGGQARWDRYERVIHFLAALPSDVAQTPRGTDAQILFERKLTCEAINGAMAFGYQNTNPPPSDDHWLAPFWKIGRKQAELEALAAPVAAQAPEGWKLVPITPTGVMKDAGHWALPVGVGGPWTASAVYQAMLDQVPSVPQAPVADGARAPQPNHRLMGRLRRFNECCEDFEADGHDVDKEDMRALADLGAVRPAPGGRHYMTDFGRYLLASSAQQAVTLTDFTYATKQATNCAKCGDHRHTPLRIDWMGGYVCLTCIDKELEARAAKPRHWNPVYNTDPVQRACGELPDGWEIEISLEKDAGTVDLRDPNGEKIAIDFDGEGCFDWLIHEAIDAALQSHSEGETR